MPKIQREGVPRAVLSHLVRRVRERSIGPGAIQAVAAWIDTNPEVPLGKWYKRFADVTLCGEGPLVLTFLTPDQAPYGEEL